MATRQSCAAGYVPMHLRNLDDNSGLTWEPSRKPHFLPQSLEVLAANSRVNHRDAVMADSSATRRRVGSEGDSSAAATALLASLPAPLTSAPGGVAASPKRAIEAVSKRFWQEKAGNTEQEDTSVQACTARLSRFWQDKDAKTKQRK